jgi:hypothetical protein
MKGAMAKTNVMHNMQTLELFYLIYTYLKLPYTISRIEMRNVETRDESIIEYALNKVMFVLIVNVLPYSTNTLLIAECFKITIIIIAPRHFVRFFLIATSIHIVFKKKNR